jgi:hypothetical protein
MKVATAIDTKVAAAFGTPAFDPDVPGDGFCIRHTSF